ncbi:MAG: hypothetical protein QNI93_16860 [Kiloniellales bacterium]|nr:hypothetical protein [Kiloniellales bacterium]MDJ0980922.1 hypothetical protein [Kiloniellales bacterium]
MIAWTSSEGAKAEVASATLADHSKLFGSFLDPRSTGAHYTTRAGRLP